MSAQADLGAKALAARDYTSAIAHYTTALSSSQSPIWLTKRSTAYHRVGQYEDALRDAENAVLVARARGKRELIASAQFRRAIALYSLGRLGDARLVLTWARKLNEKEKGLAMWQAKVAGDYEKLPEGEEGEKGRRVVVEEWPTEFQGEMKQGKKEEATKVEDKGKEKERGEVAQGPSPSVVQTPKEKIRHEWFQSSNNVTITIFAKGIPKEQAEVKIDARALEVRFPIGSSSSYDFTLDPLYHPIDPSQSTYSITPNKLEITLHKATPGMKWASLEGTTGTPLSTTANITSSTAPPISKTATGPPAYPTSSKHGPKNWDALAVTALASSSSDKDKLGDDDDEGDPLHGFFKKLYKDADPDTKRAMMKSYTESNGTALSTNWQDVGKKKVETTPPEGLEAKKWEI